ncbi:hypothetical protein l11_11120 [Neisseria weaveri LMG 5135]|nr:hypothetical protein l13_19330 [Neisseria weaveri ATCC 51223]EGV37359.1 hypothetical protein l11_11120 [Neisseria weaveri LMG 5135]
MNKKQGVFLLLLFALRSDDMLHVRLEFAGVIHSYLYLI